MVGLYVVSVGGMGKRSRDQRWSLPVGFADPVAPRVTLVPPSHLYNATLYGGTSVTHATPVVR